MRKHNIPFSIYKRKSPLIIPDQQLWDFFPRDSSKSLKQFEPLHLQRTTCIKAQKWPPTKLTHIVMNNSCVVPLTETGMEIGDRHYIWGQNGVKGYDP